MTKQTTSQIARDAAAIEAAVLASDRSDVNSNMTNCNDCHAHTFHFEVDGRMICRHVASHEPQPEVGMGASLRYVTDTRAMVITKVTAKTVTAAYVETDDEVITETACDEGAYGLRPTRQMGRLDAIIPGTERRFFLSKDGTYYSQGQRLVVGHSYSRTDWRL